MSTHLSFFKSSILLSDLFAILLMCADYLVDEYAF